MLLLLHMTWATLFRDAVHFDAFVSVGQLDLGIGVEQGRGGIGGTSSRDH